MSEGTAPGADRGTRGAALHAVELARPVLRDLREQPIPSAVLEAFARLIGERGQLTRRPLDGKPMTGEYAGARRWELGDATDPWRVVYEVDEDQWAVTVLAIGRRGVVYRPR